jgi:DNA-binding XRE family transcriptional regulator
VSLVEMKDAVDEHGASRAREADGPDPLKLGKRLRAARQQSGLGYRRLARIVGCNRSTIANIEAGRYVPSVELARRLASGLGLTLEEVFGRPRKCACTEECTALTYGRFAGGHAVIPFAGKPVAHRRDRRSRDEIGERVRRARIEAGLTQGQLGARAGVSLTTVSAIENGWNTPSQEVAFAIARALIQSPTVANILRLFNLRLCPCGECDRLTVRGGYARGCTPHTNEARERMAAAKLKWWTSDASAEWRTQIAERLHEEWNKGGPIVRGLFEAVKDGRASIPIPPETRQTWGAKWGGNTPPAAGGRRRGRPVSDTVNEPSVLERRARGESLSEIAEGEGLTVKQVRGVIKRHSAQSVP